MEDKAVYSTPCGESCRTSHLQQRLERRLATKSQCTNSTHSESQEESVKERFHHLLSICPLSLNAPYNATFKFGKSPYLIATSCTKEELMMVLAAGFKYYKDNYGFLYLKVMKMA